MADITLRRGETLPNYTDTLHASDGTAVDLTGAEVRFVATDASDGTELFNKTATKTDADAGEVEYNWDEEDTDEPGVYEAFWKVTFDPDTDPEVQYFPDDEIWMIIR